MAGPEVLVPITLFAGGFAMIFGIVYLKTKENLAMVEKGMNPKQQYNRPAPFKSLKLGLLLLGAGLGLLLAFVIDNAMTPKGSFRHDDANAAIYFGLITSYAIERKYLLDRKDDLQS
jgi:hypothetical protein